MSSTMSLNRLAEDYLADARARGLSPKTIKDAYGYALQKVFLPWCEQQGLTGAGQLDTRAMNRFTAELLQNGGRRGQLSRHSIESYVRNVNLFLNWCRREGEIGNVRGPGAEGPAARARCAEPRRDQPPRGRGTG